MTVKNIPPWGNFAMEDETGLPTLPEPDLFFRVTKVAGGWQVQIRRRSLYGFSRIEETRTYSSRETITQERVLEGAAHALTKYRDRPKDKNDYSLLGDYPPKKIEA